jgi:hypothetical protein
MSRNDLGLRFGIINKISESKRSDFLPTYHILAKLYTVLETNKQLLIKCSSMLQSQISDRGVPDLQYIVTWIVGKLGVQINLHEARHLVRYVRIVSHDVDGLRRLGHIDLRPPGQGQFNSWCSYLQHLSTQRIESMKTTAGFKFELKGERDERSPQPILKRIQSLPVEKKLPPLNLLPTTQESHEGLKLNTSLRDISELASMDKDQRLELHRQQSLRVMDEVFNKKLNIAAIESPILTVHRVKKEKLRLLRQQSKEDLEDVFKTLNVYPTESPQK